MRFADGIGFALFALPGLAGTGEDAPGLSVGIAALHERTRAEIAVLIEAAAAAARGRLFLAFREAVTEGGSADGRVDRAAMRAHASRVARVEVSAEDAGLVCSILVFFLDGDGRATLDEVSDGVEGLTGPL